MSVSDRRRYARIAMAIALSAAWVFVVGRAVRGSDVPAALPRLGDSGTPSRPVDAERSARESRAVASRETAPPVDSPRTLRGFYARRAYPGAPPVIPHPLADPEAVGGAVCLSCHREGGWAPAFGAYTPVTPHPDLVNCVQCHVASTAVDALVRTDFEAVPPPAIGRAAAPGEPPPIPHSLRMRENCLACHAGPAAVVEIRVTHPEFAECMECHAAGVDDGASSKAVGQR
jgi:cytochrome c-type protein NapB